MKSGIKVKSTKHAICVVSIFNKTVAIKIYFPKLFFGLKIVEKINNVNIIGIVVATMPL